MVPPIGYPPSCHALDERVAGRGAATGDKGTTTDLAAGATSTTMHSSTGCPSPARPRPRPVDHSDAGQARDDRALDGRVQLDRHGQINGRPGPARRPPPQPSGNYIQFGG